MTIVGEAVILIRGDSAQFTKQLIADVNKSATQASKSPGLGLLTKSFLGAAAGAVALGAETVHMASQFNSSMEMLHTQAGASQAEVDGLKGKVLDLAGAVGQSPDSLAEALYHVESVGYRANNAISILKIGAEEASIAHANLDDTLYSLTSTMKTFGDTGVAGATKDMSLLNAIVGEGDMRFQDLNLAIQTGILSTGQTFGVDIRSMGAALDFLTDRGEKADVSSTRLSMGIVLMAAPAQKAAGILQSLGVSQADIATSSQAMGSALSDAGVSQTQLASDLRKPDGIFVALSDLKDHMTAAGISASQQGTIIANVFGGARTGKAIMALYENLDGIKLKYAQIGEAASQFGEDWAATQKTMTQRWHDLTAEIQADGIRIGDALTPVASAGLTAIGGLAHGLEDVGSLLARHQILVIDFIGAWLGLKVVTAVVGLVTSGMETLALKTLYAKEAIAGLATTEELANFGALATTGQKVLGAVTGIGGAALGAIAPIASMLVVANGITHFVTGLQDADKFIKQVNSDVAKTPSSMQTLQSAIQQTSAKIDSLNASVGGGDFFHGFLGAFTGASETYLAEIGKVTGELGKLTGAYQRAGAETEVLADAMGGSNVGKVLAYRQVIQDMADKGLIDLADGVGVNTEKVKEYEAGVLHATPSQAALNQMFKDEASSATTAAQAATDLQTAINSLGVANQTLYGTTLDVNKAILTISQNVVQGSTDLNANTLSGIQNNQAILSVTSSIQAHVKAMTDQHDTQAQVNAYVFQSSMSLEQQLVHLGFNKQAVDFLVQSLLQMPPSKATKVTVPGAADSKVTTDALKKSLDGLKNKTLIVNVIDNASSILGNIHTAAAGLINLGFTPQEATNTIKASRYGAADGMLVTGPGGPRDDNHLIRVSTGETIVPAHLTPKYARSFAADGIPGFASGGLVDSLQYDATPTVQEMGRVFQSGFGGPVGSGASQWLGVVLQALALNGASAMWAPRVLSQIQFESGGNANAHQQVIDINTFNGSGGAQGLMQVLLATFLSNHVAGTSMNIFDPLANVAAGIHHAIHDDPGGLSYLGQGHGYDNGGPLMPGWTMAYNGTNKPENIQTQEQKDALIDEIRAMRGEIKRMRPVQQNITYTGVDPTQALRDANRELAETLRG